MKYIRKITTLFVGVVFFASLIIGFGVMFAVKNINVDLITYADEYDEDYNDAKDRMKVFKGESLVFIDEVEVEKVFEGSAYVLQSFNKKFPATINVVLKQRLESFAVSVDVLYSMYDSDGKYLRSALENVNPVDGSPNVELKNMPVEKIPQVAEIAAKFKEKFNALRSIASSISLDENPNVDGYINKILFHMRSGIVIQIDDYTNQTEEKINAVYQKYEKLSDRQRLGGKIRGYKIGGDDGVINADYN